jgi:hypothetical protein
MYQLTGEDTTVMLGSRNGRIIDPSFLHEGSLTDG